MNGPKLIGRYEIVAEIGRGAMGSVFKARDPAVGRIVALKTVHATALAGDQSQEYRARFYREARASGVLAHPGIVPVFDVGEHEGAPFLVMEFVDGRTLADAVKKGERFSLDRVCEFGQQIAEALGYAHRQGVIHRDIKPANILLTSREVYGSERPRITDFGIAKLAASEITTMGQLLGTPSFMPPEQFTGTPVDGRADLFSLGVILYALATGEQPFAGETMTAVSYKVVYTEPIPPNKLNPAISPRLEAAILKSLAKNPADRFQTGEELAQELVAIRSGTASAPLDSLAPVPVDADTTLGPSAVVTTGGPARTGGPSLSPMSKVTTPQPASPPATGSTPVPGPAGKQPGKKVQVETTFAMVLLAVAGVGLAVAGAWFVFDHFLSAASRAHRQALTTPAQPSPQPVVQIPQPNTTQTSSDQTGTAASASDSANTTTTPANKPNPPEVQLPAGKSSPAPPPGTAAPSKSGATSSSTAKTTTSKSKTVTPPANSPPQVPPTPAAVAANAQPAAPAAPAPAPTSSATPGTNAAATKTAPATFDPRKLDPNTSTKLKIEPSKLPNGLPINVELDRKPYLSFITGDKTDLDNLYIPAGVHELRVQIKTGGQEFDSNIVSDAFKAKKRKTLKIEILQNGKTPAQIPVPLTKDMSIFLSFPSIFDL
jgi:serine/threonine protein kinase